MDNLMEQPKDHTVKTLIGIGYIILFCLIISTGMAFFAATISSQTSEHINVVATSLPPRFPTPGAPTIDLAASSFFEDDFSDNENNWFQPTDGTYTVEVKEGELFLQSNMYDDFLIVRCGDCPLMRKPYVLQVDLRTAKASNQLFGIVFAADLFDPKTFYLFTINTESKEYGLFHFKNQNWSTRILGVSNMIKSFPNKNTLSILTDGDTAQFYINEEFVDSYTQTAERFHEGNFGFYINSAEYELIADNFTINLLGGEQ